MVGTGQIVDADWERLYSLPEDVEACRGEATCPVCGYRCVVVDNDTEIFWRDVCPHFDGQTATGFFFVDWCDHAEARGEEDD